MWHYEKMKGLLTYLALRSTSQQLFDILLRELEDLTLSKANIRGQGYDNGANMTEERSGVQSLISPLMLFLYHGVASPLTWWYMIWPNCH